MKKNVEAVLFDLDGTLADTVIDIAGSLNFTLDRLGYGSRSVDEVRRFIGDGVGELLKRAGVPSENGEAKKALEVFIPHYSDHCADNAVLYPGVKDVLSHFSGKPLAVVTNKPEAPTWKVLRALNIDVFFKAALGGDSLPVRKPSPEPLLEAARRLNVSPLKTAMVGDSPSDVQAGRAAGMFTCAVTYGFRAAEEIKASFPDATISYFEKLKEVLA